MFGLSFWRHPFTSEDPLVSKLNFWGWIHFFKYYIFEWNWKVSCYGKSIFIFAFKSNFEKKIQNFKVLLQMFQGRDVKHRTVVIKSSTLHCGTGSQTWTDVVCFVHSYEWILTDCHDHNSSPHESQIKRAACMARVCGEWTNSDEIHGNWQKQCYCDRKVFE